MVAGGPVVLDLAAPSGQEELESSKSAQSVLIWAKELMMHGVASLIAHKEGEAFGGAVAKYAVDAPWDFGASSRAGQMVCTSAPSCSLIVAPEMMASIKSPHPRR